MSMDTTDWNWNELYSGQVKDYEPPDAELVGLINSLQAGSALDVGCGAGGLLVALAGRGWKVAGIDVAQNAISAARAVLKERGLDAQLQATDAAQWTSPEQYDLVTNSFALPTTVVERAAVFAMMKKAVKPGGRILLKEHDASMTRYPFFAGYDLVDLPELRASFADMEILQARTAEYEVEERYRSVPGTSETWTAILLEAQRPEETE